MIRYWMPDYEVFVHPVLSSYVWLKHFTTLTPLASQLMKIKWGTVKLPWQQKKVQCGNLVMSLYG